VDNLWIIYLQIPESGGGPRISRNFPEFANFDFLQIFVFFCKNWNFCKFSCFFVKIGIFANFRVFVQ